MTGNDLRTLAAEAVRVEAVRGAVWIPIHEAARYADAVLAAIEPELERHRAARRAQVLDEAADALAADLKTAFENNREINGLDEHSAPSEVVDWLRRQAEEDDDGRLTERPSAVTTPLDTLVAEVAAENPEFRAAYLASSIRTYADLLARNSGEVPAADVAWKLRNILAPAPATRWDLPREPDADVVEVRDREGWVWKWAGAFWCHTTHDLVHEHRVWDDLVSGRAPISVVRRLAATGPETTPGPRHKPDDGPAVPEAGQTGPDAHSGSQGDAEVGRG